MAANIENHDATTVLNSEFGAKKAIAAIVTVKSTGITGGVPRTYNLFNGNFSPPLDPVAALPSGVSLAIGNDTFTIVVENPADFMAHDYNGAATGGTVDIKTKMIYSKD